MRISENPHRSNTWAMQGLDDIPIPSIDHARPQKMLERCPRAGQTPLVRADAAAKALGIGQLSIKDERGRMDLGSFKALGAAYVIASDAAQADISGETYITASAGNHGLSVAAGAQAFGASAVIYIAQTVPEAFAKRLRDLGAEVVRAGEDYEQCMAAALSAAQTNGWRLLSDSSWDGYTERPHRLMEGYLVMMAETFVQIDAPPTHIFLQAGVGGLAGAAAAAARAHWGDAPMIVVVEPDEAPALFASIEASRPVVSQGGVSAMGRLDCKEPSLIALKGLSRDADAFMLISEAEGQAGADFAQAHDMPSTPSGAAALAGLLCADHVQLSLGPTSHALIILSEGPE